jgi:hypothetical protein
MKKTGGEPLPFVGRRGACAYLVEWFLVWTLISGGVSLSISGGKWTGMALGLLAGVVILARLRPRAQHLPLPGQWPLHDWNVRAREMEVLRFKYARAAMRTLKLPEWLAPMFVIPPAGLLLVVVLIHRDRFF